LSAMNATRSALILYLALVLCACAPRPPEQQIVADAATALGGRDKILAVKTLVVEGEGTNGNLGQDMTMEASGQTFTITEYTRRVDLQTMRARTEQTRTPTFTYFQGQQPQKQIAGLADGVAYAIGANGTATRASNAAAKDRAAEMYHHPL